MIEALWTVEFISSTGRAGVGVVTFDQGRVFGGDSSYFYLGTYQQNGNTVDIEIHVTHYAGLPSNIFGPLEEVNLTLSGEIDGDNFKLSGYTRETKDKANFKLTRQTELP